MRRKKQKKISAKEKYLQNVFLEKVKQYNKSKMYHAHYVDLGSGMLMIIDWDGCWKYTITELEKIEKEKKEKSSKKGGENE